MTRSFVALALIAYEAIGLLATISMIGKDRKPITSGAAAVSLIVAGGAMFAIAYLVGWVAS